MQVLIDLGMVSIGLAHARRMGMLRYENELSIIVTIKFKHQLIRLLEVVIISFKFQF